MKKKNSFRKLSHQFLAITLSIAMSTIQVAPAFARSVARDSRGQTFTPVVSFEDSRSGNPVRRSRQGMRSTTSTESLQAQNNPLTQSHSSTTSIPQSKFSAGKCRGPEFNTGVSTLQCVGAVETPEGSRDIMKYNSRGNLGFSIYSGPANVEGTQKQSYSGRHPHISEENFTLDGKYLAIVKEDATLTRDPDSGELIYKTNHISLIDLTANENSIQTLKIPNNIPIDSITGVRYKSSNIIEVGLNAGQKVEFKIEVLNKPGVFTEGGCVSPDVSVEFRNILSCVGVIGTGLGNRSVHIYDNLKGETGILITDSDGKVLFGGGVQNIAKDQFSQDSFSSDGRYLAVRFSDKNLTVFDFKKNTFSSLVTISDVAGGDTPRIQSIVFDSDNHAIVTVDDNFIPARNPQLPLRKFDLTISEDGSVLLEARNILPEGWTATQSNINFAYKITEDDEYWYLSIMNLETGEVKLIHQEGKSYVGTAPDHWLGFNDDQIDVHSNGLYVTYQVRVFQVHRYTAYRGDDLFFYHFGTDEKVHLGRDSIDRPGGALIDQLERNDKRLWFEGDLIKVVRSGSPRTIYYDPIRKDFFEHLVPEGYERAKSNPGFAFKLALNEQNKYIELKLLNLATSEEQVIASGPTRTVSQYPTTISDYDISADGTTLFYVSRNVLGGGAVIRRLENPDDRLDIRGVIHLIEFNTNGNILVTNGDWIGSENGGSSAKVRQTQEVSLSDFSILGTTFSLVESGPGFEVYPEGDLAIFTGAFHNGNLNDNTHRNLELLVLDLVPDESNMVLRKGQLLSSYPGDRVLYSTHAKTASGNNIISLSADIEYYSPTGRYGEWDYKTILHNLEKDKELVLGGKIVGIFNTGDIGIYSIEHLDGSSEVIKVDFTTMTVIPEEKLIAFSREQLNEQGLDLPVQLTYQIEGVEELELSEGYAYRRANASFYGNPVSFLSDPGYFRLSFQGQEYVIKYDVNLPFHFEDRDYSFTFHTDGQKILEMTYSEGSDGLFYPTSISGGTFDHGESVSLAELTPEEAFDKFEEIFKKYLPASIPEGWSLAEGNENYIWQFVGGTETYGGVTRDVTYLRVSAYPFGNGERSVIVHFQDSLNGYEIPSVRVAESGYYFYLTAYSSDGNESISMFYDYGATMVLGELWEISRTSINQSGSLEVSESEINEEQRVVTLTFTDGRVERYDFDGNLLPPEGFIQITGSDRFYYRSHQVDSHHGTLEVYDLQTQEIKIVDTRYSSSVEFLNIEIKDDRFLNYDYTVLDTFHYVYDLQEDWRGETVPSNPNYAYRFAKLGEYPRPESDDILFVRNLITGEEKSIDSRNSRLGSSIFDIDVTADDTPGGAVVIYSASSYGNNSPSLLLRRFGDVDQVLRLNPGSEDRFYPHPDRGYFQGYELLEDGSGKFTVHYITYPQNPTDSNDFIEHEKVFHVDMESLAVVENIIPAQVRNEVETFLSERGLNVSGILEQEELGNIYRLTLEVVNENGDKLNYQLNFRKYGDIYKLYLAEGKNEEGKKVERSSYGYYGNSNLMSKDVVIYYDNGIVQSRNYSTYSSQGQLTRKYEVKKSDAGYNLFVSNKTYSGVGILLTHIETVRDENNRLVSQFQKYRNSNGNVRSVNEVQYHTNGAIKSRAYVQYDYQERILRRYEIERTRQGITTYYLNRMFSAGVLRTHIERTRTEGNRMISDLTRHFYGNGQLRYFFERTFHENGRLKTQERKQFNYYGVRTFYGYWRFDERGRLISRL